jgi:hypothetical protein
VTGRPPARDVLEALLSADLLALIDEHVREVAAEAAREEVARLTQPRRWLTLAEAAEEYCCTYEAMVMRVKRGTVESRRQGRRVYVRADEPGHSNGSWRQ